MFTVTLLLTLQTAPPLFVVFSQGLARYFDWPGFIGFALGSIAVPLALGCLGLLWRKRPGIGFLIVSLIAFFVLEAVSLASIEVP